MTAADWISDLARHAEAIPSEARDWSLIGGGEYITPIGVLVAPDDGGVTSDVAEFIAAANPATILRLIAALDKEGTENMNRRDALSFLKEERDALAARLAAVEALADQWENNEAYACRDASDCTRCVTYQGAVIRLRAALAAPTDTIKETDR